VQIFEETKFSFYTFKISRRFNDFIFVSSFYSKFCYLHNWVTIPQVIEYYSRMKFDYRSYLFISSLCLVLNCGASESLEQVRKAVCALSNKTFMYNLEEERTRFPIGPVRNSGVSNESIESGMFHVLCPLDGDIYFAFIRGKQVIALDEFSAQGNRIFLTRVRGEEMPIRQYSWDAPQKILALKMAYAPDGKKFVFRSRNQNGEIRETKSTASRARGFIKIETGGISAETVWPIKPPKLYEAYLTVISMSSNSPPECKNDEVSKTADTDQKFLWHLNWNCDDPDGDQLDFELISGPKWLEMTNQQNARIEGTPHSIDVGDNLFRISVSDGIHPPISVRLNITVE
tara:strand:+ start:717 stop:1748 length:1032 start_codon:yes stop_codon:yes gene_type:complete